MTAQTAKAESKLQTGSNCVQVWLVTGYNYDQHDIRAGGSPILGSYMWVIESDADAFIAEMQKKYPLSVQSIEIGDKQFKQMDKLPTLEEQIETFETYLKQHPLPAIGDEF
jgi:hypothetical protein